MMPDFFIACFSSSTPEGEPDEPRPMVPVAWGWSAKEALSKAKIIAGAHYSGQWLDSQFVVLTNGDEGNLKYAKW